MAELDGRTLRGLYESASQGSAHAASQLPMSEWGEARRDLMTPQTIAENARIHSAELQKALAPVFFTGMPVLYSGHAFTVRQVYWADGVEKLLIRNRSGEVDVPAREVEIPDPAAMIATGFRTVRQ